MIAGVRASLPSPVSTELRLLNTGGSLMLTFLVLTEEGRCRFMLEDEVVRWTGFGWTVPRVAIFCWNILAIPYRMRSLTTLYVASSANSCCIALIFAYAFCLFASIFASLFAFFTASTLALCSACFASASFCLCTTRVCRLDWPLTILRLAA